MKVSVESKAVTALKEMKQEKSALEQQVCLRVKLEAHLKGSYALLSPSIPDSAALQGEGRAAHVGSPSTQAFNIKHILVCFTLFFFVYIMITYVTL